MATIEVSGETLVVRSSPDTPTLHVVGRIEAPGGTFGVDERINSFMPEHGHDDAPDYPSRGDLSAETMGRVARALLEAVADDPSAYMADAWAGGVDGPGDLAVDRLDVESRETVKGAKTPLVPDHMDGWPADGTASDKVRFMLDEHALRTNEEMALAAGCSESLVAGIKADRRGDD